MASTQPTPERSALVEGRTLGHYIGGRAIPAGGRDAPVFNPATGKESRRVALAEPALIDSAVQAASDAFPAWRDTPPGKRAQIMFRFCELLRASSDEFARLISEEHGKVIADAAGEFTRGIEVCEYACGVVELLKGEHTKNAGPRIDCWSEFQPLGVVAGITPFNFPAMVPMWMFPIAIVCGNTFVLKPSEKDPSAALRLAELFSEAGLPDGVFNVVNGDREAVDALLVHPDVQAISFVGSTPVAEHIYRTGTAHGKRVQALGGAKNHAVVLPDADIDNVVDSLMGAAYGSCGERCMAISVAVCVGDEVADAVVGGLSEAISSLRIGAGDSGNSDMGPLISAEHEARVRQYVDIGLEEGATLVVDGRKHEVTGHEDGYFLGACLFDNVQANMKIYQDEIFGPVLVVVRVGSQREAMELIDAHEYGNGTCIFTRDGEAARYFTDNIKVGMVGVNVALPVPIAAQSFGGWKRSLFGDLYAYGPDAVRFYTRRKTITQRWPGGGVREGARFAFPSGH